MAFPKPMRLLWFPAMGHKQKSAKTVDTYLSSECSQSNQKNRDFKLGVKTILEAAESFCIDHTGIRCFTKFAFVVRDAIYIIERM